MADLRQALRPSAPAPPLPLAEIAARAGRRRRRRMVRATGLAAAAVVGVAAAVASLADTVDSPIATDASLSAATDGSAPPHRFEVPSTVGSGPGTDAVTTATGAATASTASTAVDPSGGVHGPLGSEPPVTAKDPASPSMPPSAAAPVGRPDQTVTVAQLPAGIDVATSTTSSWAGGFCFQVDLVNTTDRPIFWQVTLGLPGTIDTIWSAVPQPAGDGSVAFRGEPGYNQSLGGRATTTFGMCLTMAG